MVAEHTGRGGGGTELVRGPEEVWAGPPVLKRSMWRGGLHGSANTVLSIWAEGDLHCYS